jgi:hypothetical protein
MRWNLSKNYTEECLAVVGTLVILSVGGCSSLNKNSGEEPALNAAKAATPLEAVGLPGVIESAEASKTDASISPAQYKSAGANPELQQKFDNLQNRFNQKVDQTQSSVDQSIRNAQVQAARNKAAQLQNQAVTQAQKTQLDAQRRLAEMQAQARQKVVVPLNQAAHQANRKADQAADEVDRSIEKAAQTVDQAKAKASTAAGRFLDSLLPDASAKKP